MGSKSTALLFFFLLVFGAQLVLKTVAQNFCPVPLRGVLEGDCLGDMANRQCYFLCRRAGSDFVDGSCRDLQCICTRAC